MGLPVWGDLGNQKQVFAPVRLRADGTHPAGMHSCLTCLLLPEKEKPTLVVIEETVVV